MTEKSDRVLLASGSPQRKAILEELGIAYEACPMDVAEAVLEDPASTVMENSRRKLLAGLAAARPGQAVIASDTIVWLGGQVLGKPGSPEQSARYLRMLSGNAIQAYSGIALALGGGKHGWCCAEYATAHIRELSEEEIQWYISTGEPLSRAGAIGISHYGEAFVTGIDGSYSCIAGLPKNALLAILAEDKELASAVLPVACPCMLKTGITPVKFEIN